MGGIDACRVLDNRTSVSLQRANRPRRTVYIHDRWNFFTFLGIAEGLYEFNPQKIDASIPTLLDGLKTAFIASVVGVGAALSLKLRYTIFGVKRSGSATAAGSATVDDLYRCEQIKCGIDLSVPDNQRFLHAHHVNADKSDNHPKNIKLLCIRCHADEFQHSHMKENPDYAIFCTRFPKEPSPRARRREPVRGRT